MELLQKIKARIAELDHWTDKQETKADIDDLIRDTLWNRLPECYDELRVTVKKYLDSLVAKGLVGEDGIPALKCENANFFTLPNEVFLLQLPSSAFMVYAYLLLIEDRRTHTCHPSYNTIAAATGISKNTAMKSVNTLLETGLITVESSSYFDKHGMKWKGNNLYTILPVRLAADAFHQRQLQRLELEAKHRRILQRQKEYDRRHPRDALCAPIPAPAATDPSQQCKPPCGR